MSAGPGRLAAAARAAAPALAVVAGLAFVLAPALRADFLFNDDYSQFSGAGNWAWMLSLGRPLQVPLQSWGHALVVASPANVLTLRLVLLAGWIALALAVYAAVKGALGRAGAAAVVLFAFSTPAFLVSFAWLSVAINAFAYLAAAASYATGYVLLARTRGAVPRALLGLATALLGAAAFLSYQIGVILPIALAVFDQLHGGRARRPRDAVRLYALLGAGVAGSVVLLKLLLRASQVAQGERVQALAERLGSWRAVLLPLRMFDANAGLHYYYWGWLTREGALLVGVAATILVLRTAWRDVREPGPAEDDRRRRWAVAGLGFLGGALLFSIDASRELRSKPFLSLLALLVVVHALSRTRAWARLPWRGAAVGAVVVLTLLSGRHTLASGLVEFATGELAHAEAVLARADLAAARHVHLVQPANRCFAPPCYGNFEFALKLASQEDWVPPGLVRLALARLGQDPRRFEVTFSRAPAEDPAAVVVDMRDLEQRLSAQGEVVDVDGWLKRRRKGPVRVVGMSGLWLRLAPPEPEAGPGRR